MSSFDNGKRVLNFGAGPGCLPDEVLLTAQQELLNYQGTGKSIMEMSHRGKEFTKVLEDTKTDLKNLMNIPDNYEIVFLQGGATALFGGVPMNLCPNGKNDTADFLITGSWSKGAYTEAKLYCNANAVIDMTSTNFKTVTDPSQWKFTPGASYVHYCYNETVHGVELNEQVHKYIPEGVPLVCDMSSNFLSKPIDVSKFGVIFAGAQKNAGISGITIVIIRRDLLKRSIPTVPNVFNFSKKSETNSVDNTPPTFNLYITALVLKWILKNGGLEEMDKRSQTKSEKLYNAIDSSNGFYVCSIDKKYRSRMNVCFRIKNGDNELEEKFFKEADKNGITDIRGHRSVGGIRVSLYNAITIQGTDYLIDFMNKFQLTNQ